jgi:hypothetical protein
MLVVILACVVLIALTTVIHYEVLRVLNTRLAALTIPSRTKLLVVIFTAFAAHAVEMAVYGLALFTLLRHMDVGSLAGPAGITLTNSVYDTPETYTSLGFGVLPPVGPVRLLAGVEALNGLLLIGWSASFLYLAMERFWSANGAARRS